MLVILESTTYPGTTEELLLPILEKSGLRAGMDPVQATDARQRDLELRESKEGATNGTGMPSSMGHH